MPGGFRSCGGRALAQAVRDSYRLGQTDYALEPIVLVDRESGPVGRIQDGDGVVFCCRRGEREVQLTEAFVEKSWDHFPRREFRDLEFVILTRYHEKFRDLPVAFAPTKIENTLAEIVSRADRTQLHVAESEKFAHVTFFFNGGTNKAFSREEDVCVPSPRGRPMADVPELSLAKVVEAVQHGLQRRFDFIVVNFANGDVIGHTANRGAKIQCARVVDAQLGQVLRSAQDAGYHVLVTADHGNLEQMSNDDGSPHVSHTANPVPFLWIDATGGTRAVVRQASLADVAPTVLHALGLPQPPEMDGTSLVPGSPQAAGRVLLIILDGWGIGGQDEGNPIWVAPTPVWDEMNRRFSPGRLAAAGEAVGLQAGKAGNSEAGHMNLGAGRIVPQDDVRLDLAMRDGSFMANETLCHTLEGVERRGTNLHLIGLLSERSSHGSIEYPLALLRMAGERNLERVFLHVIFDGRSTEPGSAPALLERMELQMQAIGVGRIATGVGRALALDRDGNYAKTRRAYDALVLGVGKTWPAD